MRTPRITRLATVACVAVAVACGASACTWFRSKPAPSRVAKRDTMEVKLCDDRTTTQVPKDTAPTRENGQKIADSLMAQWRRKHPDSDWVAEERAKHTIVLPADNQDVVGTPKDAKRKTQVATYGKVSERDVLTWQRETLKLVVDGSRVFHSGDELGSQIGVSCDMCHPDASNTHPETYPKFQQQLGRVALLRDMINWCIEHPVRGVRLEPDDPKMRGLEAYITGQRKGKPLNYGKH